MPQTSTSQNKRLPRWPRPKEQGCPVRQSPAVPHHPGHLALHAAAGALAQAVEQAPRLLPHMPRGLVAVAWGSLEAATCLATELRWALKKQQMVWGGLCLRAPDLLSDILLRHTCLALWDGAQAMWDFKCLWSSFEQAVSGVDVYWS